MTRITLVHDDITKQQVDAIVNAANETLLGGGGVDGAIHRAAGPQLFAACAKLRGCKTGYVKITEGFNLPARFVIHAVGPVYKGGSSHESELLASCYRESLQIALEYHLQTVAFPCISTGAYRYPLQEASNIAVGVVKDFITKNPGVFSEIRFVVYSNEAYEVYERLLAV